MAKENINRDIQSNNFLKGMMLDASDMIIKPDSGRFLQNVRIVNHIGSSYVITNLQGNEASFVLTNGFTAVAAQEFNGVLYIISWNEIDGSLELGSFPSPNYGNPDINVDVNHYRPLNNLNGGPFSTDLFDTPEFPVIQKLEIQPEYDESVNMCFTIKGKTPRIVNTQFKAEGNGALFSIVTRNTQDGESSNTYTNASLNTETTLLLSSAQTLKIAFGAVESGGQVKPGNYQYVFYYMTDSFNRTSIVNQSMTCQVSFGETSDTVRGGDETQETSKRVRLSLSNIDQNFRYLKVFIMYNSGQGSVEQQYLEMVSPIEIRGTTMDFFHTGFEELREVSQDTVNVDFITIDSASASVQAGGYYFLADITQRTLDISSLRTAAGSLSPIHRQKTITVGGVGLTGYADPANVYNNLGYMGGESYPFGIVFIMKKGGSLSPVFPIRGKTYSSPSEGSAVSELATPYKGIVTFPLSNLSPYYELSGSTSNIKPRYIEIDIATLLSNSFVQENTSGFFFVRSERRPNALTQGILLPTFKAPTIEGDDDTFNSDNDEGGRFAGYYTQNTDNIDDVTVFKHLINLDSLVEPFLLSVLTPAVYDTVIAENGGIAAGYMPRCLRRSIGGFYSSDITSTIPAPNIWYSKSSETWARHWGFISGEALLSEPEMVTLLQRENMGIHQLAKINFKVGGEITPLFLYPDERVGCHYNMNNYHTIYSGTTLKKIKKTVFVPGESLSTGTDFVSKIKIAFLGNFSGSDSSHFWVYQLYNSYFGIEMLEGSIGQLVDSALGKFNPIGDTTRDGMTSVADIYDLDEGSYNNLNRLVPAAFLVNVYPKDVPLTSDELYPSIDSLVYRQVSERYSWEEFIGTGKSTKIDVFGGDCYISKVSRKLSQGPERVAGIPQAEPRKRWNIDSGLILTWWQESKYNLHLRQDKQFDISETERRSFFPFQSLGNPVQYRRYRYPETIEHSPGYSELLPPRSFFNLTTLTPTIKNRFMNRIHHSEKHIPNAFNNGFRSFLETNFKDYDASMGAIMAMFNHRGLLLVVFEHGMGITAIEQRIQTGSDAAGAIFVQTDEVLPPTLSYLSHEIGCQDHLSLVQTPSAVYGLDKAKRKIWCVTDVLKVISDESVSSWLNDNIAVNPKSGYDLVNNEVIFSTDNWTLCYNEAVKRFTSFYTMNESDFFARRNNELYSFIQKQSYKHNSESVYTLYGNNKNVIVEFVLNKNVMAAKVLDFLNIISNESPPSKVEAYSYNQQTGVGEVINISALNQYTSVDYGTDLFTQEPSILYRDKKYVVQIPYRKNYQVGSVEDKWGIEGRLRDKNIIVRLTYSNLDKPLELATILSYFRYSFS